MNFLQALLLGLVQGATEFFPISSSAHLKLTRHFLGLGNGEEWIYFDLACHAGTLLALVCFLRKDIYKILLDPIKIGQFAIALLPAVPAYFLLKPVRTALSSPAYMGYFLLLTAGLLFLACRKKQLAPAIVLSPSSIFSYSKPWIDVLSIGLMQTLALLPGISRSGSTIAAARFRGWSWIDGARFSFLLSIPTILGGEILETLKINEVQIPLSFCAIGFISSLGIGSLVVRFVFKIYERQTVKPLAWYCVAVGLWMITVFGG